MSDITKIVAALGKALTADSAPPLLTREQLAERLQVSKRSVELLESAGLPTIRFGAGGKLVRHEWAAVREWLQLESNRHVKEHQR